MYNGCIKRKRCLWDAKPRPKKDHVREQETLSKREELKALALTRLECDISHAKCSLCQVLKGCNKRAKTMSPSNCAF